MDEDNEQGDALEDAVLGLESDVKGHGSAVAPESRTPCTLRAPRTPETPSPECGSSGGVRTSHYTVQN